MLIFTKIAFWVLGISAICIGFMIFFAGPHFTACIFGDLVGLLSGVNGYSGGLQHVNIDSEMRFYSVFWIAYGAIVTWLSSKLKHYRIWAFAALGLFFSGGVGRFMSYLSYGFPDILFTVLMLVEIIGPMILAATLMLGIRQGNP